MIRIVKNQSGTEVLGCNRCGVPATCQSVLEEDFFLCKSCFDEEQAWLVEQEAKLQERDVLLEKYGQND